MKRNKRAMKKRIHHPIIIKNDLSEYRMGYQQSGNIQIQDYKTMVYPFLPERDLEFYPPTIKPDKIYPPIKPWINETIEPITIELSNKRKAPSITSVQVQKNRSIQICFRCTYDRNVHYELYRSNPFDLWQKIITFKGKKRFLIKKKITKLYFVKVDASMILIPNFRKIECIGITVNQESDGPEPLIENKKYFYKVRAIDHRGVYKDSEVAQIFYTRIVPTGNIDITINPCYKEVTLHMSGKDYTKKTLYRTLPTEEKIEGVQETTSYVDRADIPIQSPIQYKLVLENAWISKEIYSPIVTYMGKLPYTKGQAYANVSQIHKKVEINWDDFNNSLYYKIFRKSTEEVLVYTGSETSFVDVDLEVGEEQGLRTKEKYSYVIHAYNEWGKASIETNSIVFDGKKPNDVTSFKVDWYDHNSIRLSWKYAQNIEKYIIYQRVCSYDDFQNNRTDMFIESMIHVDGNPCTYAVSDYKVDMHYEFCIKAINGWGESSVSDWISVDTLKEHIKIHRNAFLFISPRFMTREPDLLYRKRQISGSCIEDAFYSKEISVERCKSENPRNILQEIHDCFKYANVHSTSYIYLNCFMESKDGLIVNKYMAELYIDHLKRELDKIQGHKVIMMDISFLNVYSGFYQSDSNYVLRRLLQTFDDQKHDYSILCSVKNFDQHHSYRQDGFVSKHWGDVIKEAKQGEVTVEQVVDYTNKQLEKMNACILCDGVHVGDIIF